MLTALKSTSGMTSIALVMSVCFQHAAIGAAAASSDFDLGPVAKALPHNGPVPKVIVISLDGAKPTFIEKAPKELVDKEKEKLAGLEAKLGELARAVERLGKLR